MRSSILTIICVMSCNLSGFASDKSFLFEVTPVTYQTGNDFIQSPHPPLEFRVNEIVPTIYNPDESSAPIADPQPDLPAPEAPDSVDAPTDTPYDAEPTTDATVPFNAEAQPPFVQSDTNGYVWLGECGESCSYGGCGECCWSFGRCLCDESRRSVTAYAGGIFLKREDPTGGLLFLNPADARQHIKAGDFNFGVQSGVEAGVVIHEMFGDSDLDIRVFNIDDWSDNVARTLPGNATRINSTPPVDVAGPRATLAGYSSQLTNIEANVRHRVGHGCEWLTFLTGFRYMNLDERLSGRMVDSTGILPDQIVNVNADNHLYGLQVGLDATVCGDTDYCLEGYARAGIYGNDSDAVTNRTLSGTAPGSALASGSGDRTAFVGEIGVKAKYRITDFVNLFGRYQVLALSGVATASDQLGASSFSTGGIQVVDSTVIYHGATFGLEYIY